MDQGRRARRARYPDRQGAGGAVDGDAKAIIILCLAGQTGQMEIAWIVGGCRPAFDHGTERLGQRGDETTVASADGENVGVRRCAIGFSQGRGQGQPCRAIGSGHDILGEVRGAQAEFAVGQRAGRIIGAPDDKADNDGRP